MGDAGPSWAGNVYQQANPLTATWTGGNRALGYLGLTGNTSDTWQTVKGLVGKSDPNQSTPPTDAEIAAKEPDKERLRRQRMAALLAQGRSGTIMGQTQASNVIGAGPGKTLIGQ